MALLASMSTWPWLSMAVTAGVIHLAFIAFPPCLVVVARALHGGEGMAGIALVQALAGRPGHDALFRPLGQDFCNLLGGSFCPWIPTTSKVRRSTL